MDNLPLFIFLQVSILFLLINGWYGVTKKTMITFLGGIIPPYLPGKDPLNDTEKPILFGFAKISTGEFLPGLGFQQLILGMILFVAYVMLFLL